MERLRYRPQALLVLAVIPAALIIAFGAHVGAGGAADAKAARFEQEARATARQFFHALDSRRFDTVCNLFSEGFYNLNAIKSKKLCTLSLRYSLSPAGVRYRIVYAHATENRASVGVVADGVLGELVLVRDRGRFRVLSLGARGR
jgi:hypothetical protein